MGGYTLEPTEQTEISTDVLPSEPSHVPHTVYPTPVCRFENVLGEQRAEALLSYVLRERRRFAPAAMMDQATGQLKDSGPFFMLPVRSAAFSRYMAATLPRVKEAFGLQTQLTHTDMTLAAYGEGGHMGVHTDASKVPDPPASVSAIYYLHRRPRGFDGGQLRIYDTVVCDGQADRADSYRVIEPVHDTIVFFPATAYHAVTPATCPSGEFADYRFTLSMWAFADRQEDISTPPVLSPTLRAMAQAAARLPHTVHRKGTPLPLPEHGLVRL